MSDEAIDHLAYARRRAAEAKAWQLKTQCEHSDLPPCVDCVATALMEAAVSGVAPQESAVRAHARQTGHHQYHWSLARDIDRFTRLHGRPPREDDLYTAFYRCETCGEVFPLL